MGASKIKLNQLDEDFKLPLNKLEEMPTAEDVGASPVGHTHILSDVDGASPVGHTHILSDVGITVGTEDLPEGATLEYGKIYLVLEEEE